MSQTILVTGGAGYIGSHTVLSLLNSNFNVIVADNLINSSVESIERVQTLANKAVKFVEADCRDAGALNAIFSESEIYGVIHFAGLKAVGESVQKPLEYYDNNVNGTLTLLAAMQKASVKRLIFSSSATVYGEEAPVPYKETYPRGTTSNPYGTSKASIEKILEDLLISDPEWSVVLLRYFNPVGAHESGKIGEDPLGIPNNLMPFMSQVAIGKREKLSVFGGDYATHDGTCRRDYLHVMDLAEGHVQSVDVLANRGVEIFNLGTGSPVSVLEMIHAFELASGKKVPYDIVDRRAGDLPEFWADPAKANDTLGWQATRTLDQMMADTWRWQANNPEGYRK